MNFLGGEKMFTPINHQAIAQENHNTFNVKI